MSDRYGPVRTCRCGALVQYYERQNSLRYTADVGTHKHHRCPAVPRVGTIVECCVCGQVVERAHDGQKYELGGSPHLCRPRVTTPVTAETGTPPRRRAPIVNHSRRRPYEQGVSRARI